MTALDKKLLVEKNKKRFGDLPLEILENIQDDGLIYYTKHPKTGEKMYAPLSSLSLPIHSEQYTGRSKTQQQFKDDADINLVLKKYGAFKDYVPEDVSIPLEYFRDLSMLPSDFTESLNVIAESNQMFMDLPAHLRRAVNDDPRRLLELSQSPEGLETLKKLGFGIPSNESGSSSDDSDARVQGLQTPALKKAVKGVKAPANESDEDGAT